MVNPNPFDAISVQLNEIKLAITTLTQLTIELKAQAKSEKIDEGKRVPIREAANIIGMSPDRLYVIHKDYFNTKKFNKKLLFLVTELEQYNNGDLKPKYEQDISQLSAESRIHWRKKIVA